MDRELDHLRSQLEAAFDEVVVGIASLRQDVEDLVEAVRMQEKGIDELRATLDWIKERLLLR